MPAGSSFGMVSAELREGSMQVAVWIHQGAAVQWVVSEPSAAHSVRGKGGHEDSEERSSRASYGG